MERTISIEDRIKRAEAIHAQRYGAKISETEYAQGHRIEPTQMDTNKNEKKKRKIFKKIIMQAIIIYLAIYITNNSNYIFSKEFLNRTKEILSHNIDFTQTYKSVKNKTKEAITKLKNKPYFGNQSNTETNTENSKTEENTLQENNNNIGGSNEQEISEIKSKITFIKPIEGTISSKYGQRNPTTESVPKNHTGIDIAAPEGTKIKSATDGEVVLCSEEGDYGKHIKIQNGEISIIYAHCSNIYVKHGDTVKQGQEIAEVGSTGNSTGPHLHFEVRLREKTVNPQELVDYGQS